VAVAVINDVVPILLGGLVISGVGAVSHQLAVHPSRLPLQLPTNIIEIWNKPKTINQIIEENHEILNYPVGARLSRFYRRWSALGAHPAIVAKIQYGISLEWKGQPPPLLFQPAVISGYQNQHKMDLLKDSVKQMLAKGAIQVVPDAKAYPGFYSRLFLVPKPGNKWRPVIDLSQLNKFVKIPHFQMETASTIRSSLRQGEWVTSIDLTDAYFHLKIKRKFQRYFRFHIQGVTYQFLAMPFGLGTAPLEFTQVGKQFKAIAFSLNLRINQYLDDWLHRARTRLECVHNTINLLQLVIYLGFVPNFPKSLLEPTQRFEFLGEKYDLTTSTVYPTQKRLEKIKEKTSSFINSQTKTVRQWMSLTGLLQSTTSQVDMSRLRIRPLQWRLKTKWSWSQSLEKKVSLDEETRDCLQWWGQKEVLMKGVPLHPPKPQISIYTDASTHGWGAHCEGYEISGLWTKLEQGLHINLLELKAILLALRHFISYLRGKVVMVLCDNSTAVAYLKNQGGTKVAQNMALSWLILTFIEKHKIQLQVRHIPGHLNVVADRLSRRGQILQTEWSLSPQVFHQLCKIRSKPMIDLFATSLNRKLELYVSPFPDQNAIGVDAMSLDWTGKELYAYPPTKMITVVLRKARDEPCKLLLIAPAWPSQVWFPDLMDLTVEAPVQLPQIRTLLKQPGNPPYYDPNLQMRNLHAWSIDTRNSSVKGSPSRWLQEFQLRRENPPVRCINQEWTYLSNGQRIMNWMQAIQLSP